MHEEEFEMPKKDALRIEALNFDDEASSPPMDEKPILETPSTPKKSSPIVQAVDRDLVFAKEEI